MAALSRQADRVAATPGDVTAAEVALQTGRWREAAAAFATLADETGDPWAHEGLAQAAWWLDDAETTLTAREAAYRGFRALGDQGGAVRAAAALGYDSMLFGGGVAVGRGWLARAADLLGGRTDLQEAGWLAVRVSEVALAVDHDPTSALAAAQVAQEIAATTADSDLLIVGQALAGLSQVHLGEVGPGMQLLDAAAAAATAGDVEDLMWMGKICCWLISACHQTLQLDRAAQWCLRVEEICRRNDLDPLFSVCRTQYASVLLAHGACDQAESTLSDILLRLQGSRRLGRQDAVAQLGELRRRQGRLADAESLFGQVGFHSVAVTGLARVRLARGDAEHAWSTIAELLRALPAEALLERVDALAVAVAAGLAAGHRDDAQEAAGQLRAAADVVGTDAFLGRAAAAEAQLSGPQRAIPLWQDAIRHFGSAGLAFDQAEGHIELASLLVATGDDLGARHHATSALEALRPLRAGTAIDRARALLTPGGTGPLTPRQTDVLRLVARGLSNSEIAGELHLSEHTVHRHIANIYRALGLASRAAAATYAASRGLI